jgi:hypothetical protein
VAESLRLSQLLPHPCHVLVSVNLVLCLIVLSLRIMLIGTTSQCLHPPHILRDLLRQQRSIPRLIYRLSVQLCQRHDRLWPRHHQPECSHGLATGHIVYPNVHWKPSMSLALSNSSGACWLMTDPILPRSSYPGLWSIKEGKGYGMNVNYRAVDSK